MYADNAAVCSDAHGFTFPFRLRDSFLRSSHRLLRRKLSRPEDGFTRYAVRRTDRTVHHHPRRAKVKKELEQLLKTASGGDKDLMQAGAAALQKGWEASGELSEKVIDDALDAAAVDHDTWMQAFNGFNQAVTDAISSLQGGGGGVVAKAKQMASGVVEEVTSKKTG